MGITKRSETASLKTFPMAECPKFSVKDKEDDKDLVQEKYTYP